MTQVLEDEEPITITLSSRLIAQLDGARGPLSRSTFFRRLFKRSELNDMSYEGLEFRQIDLPDDGRWLQHFVKEWLENHDDEQDWRWHTRDVPIDIWDTLEQEKTIKDKGTIFLMDHEIRWLQQEFGQDIDCCIVNEEEIDEDVEMYLDLMIKALGKLVVFTDPPHEWIKPKLLSLGLDVEAYVKDWQEAFEGEECHLIAHEYGV
jgi:hypothetical protein